jgi:hypothetical protein
LKIERKEEEEGKRTTFLMKEESGYFDFDDLTPSYFGRLLLK